jgi:hypothetical protein
MSILCVARWQSARGMIEWPCTQERLNLEVAITFCVAARYRRATVGSSHDDARPDNSTLHTGAVRPQTDFLESLFFISPRTGHGSLQVLKMLPVFVMYFAGVRFSCGGDASIFLSGPVEANRGTSVLSRRVGSYQISWRILSLVKRTLRRLRAGFEP